MADNVIFGEKVLSFYPESTFGCYASSESPASFSLTDNEEYRVMWDTDTYTRTAFSFSAADGSACIAVGNPVAAGLTPNTDTFAIVYDATHNYMWFLSLETKSTHTVAIYQEVVEEAEMRIVLRDHSATPEEHALPERLRLNTADGGTTEFVHESLVPEMLENVPITLNFSGGNQYITAEDGTAVKSAIIQQPETLMPENIAEGVEIAGIVGALVGGGGALKIASGTFVTTSANTIAHNLGVIPDIIIVMPSTSSYDASGTYNAPVIFGFSTALKAAYSFLPGFAYACTFNNTALRYRSYGRCIDMPFDAGYPNCIREANETTFILNRTSDPAPAVPLNVSMRWIAIGGVT